MKKTKDFYRDKWRHLEKKNTNKRLRQGHILGIKRMKEHD